MLRRIGPGLAIATIFVGPASAADDAATSLVVLSRCQVQYERAALLGTSQPGVLQDRLVEIGDRVKAGQVLGRLRDADARAEVELREAAVASDVEIRVTEARHAEKVAKLKTSEALRARNYISREDFDLLRLEAQTAAMSVEEAKHHRALARIQVKQAQESLRAREIASPIDGVVVEVAKNPGETIATTDPVFRVIDPDRLRVTGHLDVADAWAVRPGQTVRFIPEVGGVELPIEAQSFAGRITFVDAEIDPATQTCRVLATVENRDGLIRAGMAGRLAIATGAATAAAGAGREAIAKPKPAEAERRRDPAGTLSRAGVRP